MIFLLEWLFDGFVPRGNDNSKVLITDTSREIRKNGEMAVAALHLPTSCTSRQHLIVKDSNLSSSTMGPSVCEKKSDTEPLPLFWRVIFRIFATDDSLAFRLMRTTVVGSQCSVDSKARVYLKLTATCHHSHNSRCIVTWDGLKAGGLLGWPNLMRGHFRFGYPWKKDVVQHEILPFFRV